VNVSQMKLRSEKFDNNNNNNNDNNNIQLSVFVGKARLGSLTL